MEIKGKIIIDIPLQTGVSKAGREWKKKEWVLETVDTQFPRQVKFDCFGDRADTVRVEVGKIYTVSVDAESREFNGRWYTDLHAYSAREENGAGPVDLPPSNIPPFGAEPANPGYQAPAADAPASDDLPF